MSPPASSGRHTSEFSDIAFGRSRGCNSLQPRMPPGRPPWQASANLRRNEPGPPASTKLTSQLLVQFRNVTHQIDVLAPLTLTSTSRTLAFPPCSGAFPYDPRSRKVQRPKSPYANPMPRSCIIRISFRVVLPGESASPPSLIELPPGHGIMTELLNLQLHG
jgi:hypothetical protein